MDKVRRNYYLTTEIINKENGEEELSILFQCDLQTIDELTTCFDSESDFIKYLNDKYLLSCKNLHLTYNFKGINEKNMIYKEDRAIVTSIKLNEAIFDHISRNCIWVNGGIDKLDPYIEKQREYINNHASDPGLYANNIIDHIRASYLNYRNCCLIFKKDAKYSDPKFSNYRTSFKANKEYIDNLFNQMQIKLKNPLFSNYLNQQKLLQKQKEQKTNSFEILENTKKNRIETEEADIALNNIDVLTASGFISEDSDYLDSYGRSR